MAYSSEPSTYPPAFQDLAELLSSPHTTTVPPLPFPTYYAAVSFRNRWYAYRNAVLHHAYTRPRHVHNLYIPDNSTASQRETLYQVAQRDILRRAQAICGWDILLLCPSDTEAPPLVITPRIKSPSPSSPHHIQMRRKIDDPRYITVTSVLDTALRTLYEKGTTS